MRKLLLIALFIHGIYAQEKKLNDYEACEDTKKEAKLSLASVISSNIISSYKEDTTVKTDKGSSTVKKEANRLIQSVSKLTLTNITYRKKHGQFCAKTTAKDLKKTARGQYKKIALFTTKNLPKNEVALCNKLDERLTMINQVKVISTIFPDLFKKVGKKSTFGSILDGLSAKKNPLQVLEQKSNETINLRKKHFKQQISFAITPSTANVTIDGINYKQNFAIALPKGEHSYVVHNDGYAPLEGSFSLKENEVRKITLDIVGNKYPKITFKTMVGAFVKIDGKKHPANKPITLKPVQQTYTIEKKGYCPLTQTFTPALGSDKILEIDIAGQQFPTLTIQSKNDVTLNIDGNTPWPINKEKTFPICAKKEITYATAYKGSKQNGSVSLTMGEHKTLTVDYLSSEDIQYLKELRTRHEKEPRFVAGFHYNYGSPQFLGVLLDFMSNNDWLRSGYGMTYNLNASSFDLDLHYTMALQLTHIGNDLPLHLGKTAFIPYGGFQLALGYSHLSNQFGIPFKLVSGVNITLTDAFDLKLYYHQDFTFLRQSTLGVALSMPSNMPDLHVGEFVVSLLGDTFAAKDASTANRVAKVFEEKPRYVLSYGFDIAPTNTSATSLQKGVSLDYLDHKKWLRYGAGVTYTANQDSASVANIHYTGAIQLSGMSNFLNLFGAVPLIPYFGAQVGLGYKNDPSQSNSLSFGVPAKFVTGLDIAFTSYVSLAVYYNQEFNFTKEKSYGLALSLIEPF